MSYFKQCVSDLEIPEKWVDVSYGNDACPSYQTAGEGEGFHIFIDHADPKEREDESWTRFAIRKVGDEGLGDYVWQGDSWNKAKSIMEEEA